MRKILICTILSLSLLACTKQNDSQVNGIAQHIDNNEEVLNLELLVYANQGMMANYESVLNKFNDSHDDIKVHINNVFGEDWTDYEKTLRSYLLSGKVPDIIDISVMYRDSMIQEGLLMDLSPFAEKSGVDFSLYFDNQFEGLKIDNALYGIPSGALLMGVFINKDLFRKAGVDIPSSDWENTWDLDEFADAARKITALTTNEENIYGFTTSFTIGWIFPLLMGNDSSFLSEPSDSCSVLDPESKEVFEYLNTLLFEEKVSPGLMELISIQSYQYFMDGSLGFTIDGNWWMEGFRDSINFDWGVVPMPMGEKIATGMYVDFWAVPSASPNGEEAFEVLQFFMEEEQQKSGIMKGIPLLKSSAHDIYSNRFPDMSEEEIQVWFQGIAHGHVPAYFSGWSDFQNESTEILNKLALSKISLDDALSLICDSYTNNHRNKVEDLH